MTVSLIRTAQDGAFTLRDLISGIPLDPAAIIAYLLVAGFIGFIWWGNRRGGGGTPTGPSGASTSPPEPPARNESEEGR